MTALAVATFTLTACSSGAGSSTDAPFEVAGSAVATTKVQLPKSYRFDPAVITIASGSTVTWTNEDDFPHNVHLLDGSEVVKDLPIGGSASIDFADPGTVYYECSIHPQQMHGKIVVSD
jgi:plastocyanin